MSDVLKGKYVLIILSSYVELKGVITFSTYVDEKSENKTKAFVILRVVVYLVEWAISKSN